MRLQEVVWGGTGDCPGFSRCLQESSHLAETGQCGRLFGKFQTFLFIFFSDLFLLPKEGREMERSSAVN